MIASTALNTNSSMKITLTSLRDIFEKFGRLEYIENGINNEDVIVKYIMIDDSKKAYKWLKS